MCGRFKQHSRLVQRWQIAVAVANISLCIYFVSLIFIANASPRKLNHHPATTKYSAFTVYSSKQVYKVLSSAMAMVSNSYTADKNITVHSDPLWETLHQL